MSDHVCSAADENGAAACQQALKHGFVLSDSSLDLPLVTETRGVNPPGSFLMSDG